MAAPVLVLVFAPTESSVSTQMCHSYFLKSCRLQTIPFLMTHAKTSYQLRIEVQNPAAPFDRSLYNKGWYHWIAHTVRFPARILSYYNLRHPCYEMAAYLLHRRLFNTQSNAKVHKRKNTKFVVFKAFSCIITRRQNSSLLKPNWLLTSRFFDSKKVFSSKCTIFSKIFKNTGNVKIGL